MIEKTKLNSIYGVFASHPYRNYADTDSIHCNYKPYRNKVKETIKIDSTGHIIKITIISEVTYLSGNNIKK